ncbi:WD domain containing protein [Sarocladium implicatum]|nr:WD domain containing protein [Sarocladium implicatum]
MTSHAQFPPSDPASGLDSDSNSDSDFDMDMGSSYSTVVDQSVLHAGTSTLASSIDYGSAWESGMPSFVDLESIHPYFHGFFSHTATPSAHQPQPATFLPYHGPSYLPYTVPGGDGFPHVLEPERRNLRTTEFLMAWSADSSRRRRPGPAHQRLERFLRREMGVIKYSNLSGDNCDLQGIDWASMGVTREAARQRRLETFENYFNVEGVDHGQVRDERQTPCHGKLFRFRRTDALKGTRLAHFQLRDALACPSRTQAYYPTRAGIDCINPLTGVVSRAIPVSHNAASFTSVAAGLGIVVAGTLNGFYFIKSLDAQDGDGAIEGLITREPQAITNHLDLFKSRDSGLAHVGVCSNDGGFRIMDVETQTVVNNSMYELPCNSSALSKDGRLRALMGDYTHVRICDAVSGKELQSLRGHQDYGFAAAWSGDGWTLATGNQDKRVCIWDSRKWSNTNGNSTPVTTIWSEMAGVRSLRFSPLGSGKPVLVAGEEADFVSIIDAQTYNSKQTVDIFGAIGGIDFTNEGRNLNVLCCDPGRGGLLQFERCGLESEPVLDMDEGSTWGLDYSSSRDPRPPGFSEARRRDLSQVDIQSF